MKKDEQTKLSSVCSLWTLKELLFSFCPFEQTVVLPGQTIE